MEEKESKKGMVRLPVLAALLLVVGFLTGRTYQMIQDHNFGSRAGKSDITSTSETLNLEGITDKINYLRRQIDGYYLEEVDYENVEEYIYKGMLAGLDDPYSEYYTPEEYQLMMESTAGTYCGIGAVLMQNGEDKSCTITSVLKGSPAEEAGLAPEDVILKVDDLDVVGMDLNQIVSYVKGEENSKVRLTILRDGETTEIQVTRRTIEVETVTSKMLEDEIGYIFLSEFDEVSPEQFQTALEDLKAQGMKGLIVDLRNNPGGVLTVVNEILDGILPEGLLVYTEDKYGNRQDYYSDEEHQLEIPMVVLINEYSASASEIFAGAMKDYDRATLVGTTTYGKGIVQRIVDLEDGSAMKLTIAKYYTPSGQNIHDVGIEPDVVVELPEELKEKTELTLEEDTQLQSGIRILQDKIR